MVMSELPTPGISVIPQKHVAERRAFWNDVSSFFGRWVMNVVMSAEGAVALRRRLALRCSTAPPGPLQTRYALTLAAALLKSDQRDLVAIVASTLAGAPLAETLRALPEELEGLSMHPNLREQRRSELDTGAPVALDAILARRRALSPRGSRAPLCVAADETHDAVCWDKGAPVWWSCARAAQVERSALALAARAVCSGVRGRATR